jgi:sugar lactone lactonase YvrE
MSTYSRREAIRWSAAAVAGSMAGVGGVVGPFVHARGKSGLDPIILGEGEHRYEVQHDWGRLPERIAYGNTHGVCEDAAGNIYIKHTVHSTSQSGDAIVVFDKGGKFIRSWGEEYRGGAHGLHLSREADGEYLYLCDTSRGTVDKTTLAGEKVWSRTCPMESGHYANASEYKPTNVAVVPEGVAEGPDWKEGHVFVADGYGKNFIHRYTKDGEYLGSFGGTGNTPGLVSCPHGLMIDARDAKNPVLVVADRSNNRLQLFTPGGEHIGFVTDELRQPCHFDTRDGVLLVPDLLARVTLLDAQNKLICHLGDDNDFRLRAEPREKFTAGKFIAPHSAIFDRDGNIFVVEWVEVGRVTKLRRVG